MATLTVDLRDWNDTPVEFGDRALVTFQEVSTGGGDWTEEFNRLPITVEAEICWQLAKGLLIKILKIVDDGEGTCDLKIGQRVRFARTVCEWYKMEAEMVPATAFNEGVTARRQ